MRLRYTPTAQPLTSFVTVVLELFTTGQKFRLQGVDLRLARDTEATGYSAVYFEQIIAFYRHLKTAP